MPSNTIPHHHRHYQQQQPSHPICRGTAPAPTPLCVAAYIVLQVNGFNMYKAKSRFGPAQQAYVLLNAFQRFKVSCHAAGSQDAPLLPLLPSCCSCNMRY
jgi:hypothetical protein